MKAIKRPTWRRSPRLPQMTEDPAKHIKLVFMWAIKFKATHPVEDSEEFANGCIGLMEACWRYDPTHLNEYGEPIRFSTYASWWIKQAIMRPGVFKRRLKRGGGKIKTLPFSYMGDLFQWSLAAPEDDDVISRDEQKANRARIKDFLRVVDPRTRKFIICHYMLGHTLREIAKVNSPITAERVRQVIVKGMRKINNYIERISNKVTHEISYQSQSA